jgi:hypothetical protein
MSSRFDPSDRHSEDLIQAIYEAAHIIAHAITEGFQLMANAETQALADLQQAVVDLGTAVAAEINALQAAINAQGVNNSPAIETSVANIRSLIGGLNTSVAAASSTAGTTAPSPTPATPASPAPAVAAATSAPATPTATPAT